MVLQIGFGFGDLVGGLVSELDNILNIIGAVLANLALVIYNALIFVWNTLVAAFDFIFHTFLRIVDHLRAVAEWIHNRLISKIVEWVGTIKAKLHQIFDPILKVIHKIKQLQDWYYNNVLKPYLDLIQRIRRVLLIFRLLHFRFAQQLDTYLAQQEAKIVRAFISVQVRLNQLINWVNLFIDPFGNIYSNVFLNAALTSINALWALLWGAQNGQLTSAQQSGQARDAAAGTRADTISGVRLRVATGLTPDDTALQVEARQDFAALGYTI